MVEGELVEAGTGEIEENKRDNGMTSPSCSLPIVNRLEKSEVDEKFHERFCDTLNTKSGIHLSRKPFFIFLGKSSTRFFLALSVVFSWWGTVMDSMFISPLPLHMLKP